MNTIISDNPTTVGREAAAWCHHKILQHNVRSIFLPAGKTPEALYEVWCAERPSYLNNIDLLQIDDVLTGEKRGMFKSFFDKHLPGYERQLKYIDTANQPAELGMLGLGLNGHVAFHEPGVDSSFFSGCVRLNELTCDHLGLERGTWGITYGAGAFMNCKSILMMVNGSSKREILKRLLAGDPTVPAAALLKHTDLTIIADREAWPTVLPTRNRESEFAIRKPKENDVA
jgi:6-phosphogluconolactonase/glucosamine-6-phosphate isomerase/deaminase